MCLLEDKQASILLLYVVRYDPAAIARALLTRPILLDTAWRYVMTRDVVHWDCGHH